MDNNLIYEYCLKEKVAICFKDIQELQIILALFKMENYTRIASGAVSFYVEHTRDSVTRFRATSLGYMGNDYIHITAQEFFTLALPNKSILESIK
jgi:hypothetical protein